MAGRPKPLPKPRMPPEQWLCATDADCAGDTPQGQRKRALGMPIGRTRCYIKPGEMIGTCVAKSTLKRREREHRAALRKLAAEREAAERQRREQQAKLAEVAAAAARMRAEVQRRREQLKRVAGEAARAARVRIQLQELRAEQKRLAEEAKRREAEQREAKEREERLRAEFEEMQRRARALMQMASYPEYVNNQRYNTALRKVARRTGAVQAQFEKLTNRCLPGGAFELSLPQRFGRFAIHPLNPHLRSLLAWHTVGSGKTCFGQGVLGQFANRVDPDGQPVPLFWVARSSILAEAKKRFQDCFTNADGTPAVKTREQFASRVNFYTYKSFTNLLRGGYQTHNEYYRRRGVALPKSRLKPGGDILRDAVVIVDEPHLLVADELSAQEQGDAEVLENRIRYSYETSGTRSVRVVLLTGTPFTTRVGDTLRLLNWVIPTGRAFPNNRTFPLTLEAFKREFFTPDGRHFSAPGLELFRYMTRGVVSYFDSSSDYSRFARKQQNPTVMAKPNRSFLLNLFHCDTLAAAGKGQRTKWAECYRDRSGLAAERLPSNMQLDKPSWDPKAFRAHIADLSPKAVALYERIRALDEADQQKHGRKFKHLIFSSSDPKRSVKVIAGMFAANGHRMVVVHRAGAFKGSQVPLRFETRFPQAPRDAFIALTKAPIGRAASAHFEESQMKKARRKIFDWINARPENVRGERARFILLDRVYKEGVDVFDVKYVHIWERQLTRGADIQAEGRGVRRCGQAGLPFEAGRGWTVQIFHYDVQPPRVPTVNVPGVEKMSAKEINKRAKDEAKVKRGKAAMDWWLGKYPCDPCRGVSEYAAEAMLNQESERAIVVLLTAMQNNAVDRGLYVYTRREAIEAERAKQQRARLKELQWRRPKQEVGVRRWFF